MAEKSIIKVPNQVSDGITDSNGNRVVDIEVYCDGSCGESRVVGAWYWYDAIQVPSHEIEWINRTYRPAAYFAWVHKIGDSAY